jgi:hypothetical protein
MKRNIHHYAILMLLLAAGRLAAAEETNSVSPQDLSAFKIISERNIFNASRSAGRSSRPRPVQERAAKVESFTLVGTMSYEKGRFAFFDGTSTAYRKTVKPADTIAGYKINDISSNHIQLAAANNQTIDLQVGMQMKRQDEGPWSLVAHAEPYASSSEPAAASAAGAASTAESDVMKRLMQKREQEEKNEK